MRRAVVSSWTSGQLLYGTSGMKMRGPAGDILRRGLRVTDPTRTRQIVSKDFFSRAKTSDQAMNGFHLVDRQTGADDTREYGGYKMTK